MMRSSAPALVPVFRSTAHAEILAATLLHPARERTDASAGGVAREPGGRDGALSWRLKCGIRRAQLADVHPPQRFRAVDRQRRVEVGTDQHAERPGVQAAAVGGDQAVGSAAPRAAVG